MKKNVLFLVCAVMYFDLTAQTFSLRSRLNYQAAQYDAMVAKDSFIYCSGIVADTIPPFHTVNIFSKYNLKGELLICKVFKGDSGEYEVGTFYNSLINTHDNGFALTGYTVLNNQVKALLIKYDSVGTVEFYKTYKHPTSQTFFGYRVIEYGGDFYIQGTLSYANYDRGLFVVKTDMLGNEQWRKFYGTSSTDELAAAFVKTSDNRLLIAGQRNNRQYSNYHLFKSWSYLLLLDTAGNIIRDTVGEDENMGIPQSLIQTQDGNFVYCADYYVGKLQWLGYYTKGYVAKIDSNLNTLWEGKFGDSSSLTGLRNLIELPTSELLSVGTNYDANYISTSDYHNNGLIVKLNANGNQIWRKDYRGVTRIGQQLEDNILHDCDILGDGSIFACGVAQDVNDTFPQQAWLLRIDADGCMDDGFCGYTGVNEIPESSGGVLNSHIKVYPNPAQNLLTILYETEDAEIVIRITDLLGREMYNRRTTGGNNIEKITTSDWSNGAYIYELKSHKKKIGSGIFMISQ